MRYYDSTRDAKAVILDHYTGVGEVLAVHDLDNVFGMLHRPIRVKRGSLFSLDDAKGDDLIFIGSPSENLTLLEIPGTREFTFKRMDSGPRRGNMGILTAYAELQRGSAQYYQDYLRQTVNLMLPDRQIQQAYDWARVSMLQGVVDNPYLGSGLIAGYRPRGRASALASHGFLGAIRSGLRSR